MLSGASRVDLVYALSASQNPLYRGKYEFRGRYQTYGQHSFIYDVVRAASRRHLCVTLLIEGLAAFPLVEPLKSVCRIVDASVDGVDSADVILLDEPTDYLLTRVPSDAPALCVVHRKNATYSASVVDRSQGFVCMTEGTLEFQAGRLPNEKLLLVHHGVDLQRFQPAAHRHAPDRQRAEILFYSRLDRDQQFIPVIVQSLIQTGHSITVLGDGDSFWQFSDRFGDRITLINHIPCHSIHHFLHHFSVVVSAGRGVMEALACGLPALCAGFDYGGVVLPENIRRHLRVGLTGYRMGVPLEQLGGDVQMALSLPPQTCRAMAEEHCSVETFIERVLTFAS